MVIGAKSCIQLPPGFRFHPTDEELITYYLQNQAKSKPCPVSIIPEVDIYKFDPWELPEKSELIEKEWYFFTPRERKYPNGERPNRAAVSGYWKATGTDRAIRSGSKSVGVKKTLVFYKGRPPKGIKTDWIMHEYRLNNKAKEDANKRIGSMRLDDWVLCRIYKKDMRIIRSMDQYEQIRVEDPSSHSSHTKVDVTVKSDDDAYHEEEEEKMKFPRTFSLAHLLEVEYMVPLTQLLSQNSYQYHPSGETDDSVQNLEIGDMRYSYTDFGKFQQMNQSGIFQPSVFDTQS